MTSSVLLEGAMCSQQHQHTALFACDGVHQYVMLCGGELSVSIWCGVVVGLCRGKKGRGEHTVKQKQKGHFPKPLFPFSLFPPIFLPLFFPCLPLFHHNTLLIHTLTYSCFTHECICEESKALMMQHLIHFIVFSFCSNSLFLFFSFCR